MIKLALPDWNEKTLLISCLCLFASLILYICMKIYKNYKLLAHIPGFVQVTITPMSIPIISPYVYFIGAEQTAAHTLKLNGNSKIPLPLFKVSMFNHSTVWITDKELMKEVCVSKASSFGKPSFIYDMFSLFGENILSADSYESWKKHHRIASPAFSTPNLELVCDIARESSEKIMEKWSNNGSDKFLLELTDFDKITSNVLLKAAFGLRNISIFDNGNHEFISSLQLIMKRALVLRRFFDEKENTWLFPIFSRISGVQNALKVVGGALDSAISERKKEFEMNESLNRRDLLSLLVKANLEDNVLTDKELKSNSILFALAGFETTSTAISWIIYELAKQKEIQLKCQQEIDTVLSGKEGMSLDDYNSLHYLNAVIFEGLRLHPPVAEVVKYVCKKNATIGEFAIPKGTSLHLLLCEVNRNEKYWTNAEDFIPERFLTPEQKERAQNDFTWLAFSLGNRKCIGYKMALIEVAAILSCLLRKFEFELLNDERVDPVGKKISVTTKPDNLKVSIKKRSN